MSGKITEPSQETFTCKQWQKRKTDPPGELWFPETNMIKHRQLRRISFVRHEKLACLNLLFGFSVVLLRLPSFQCADKFRIKHLFTIFQFNFKF